MGRGSDPSDAGAEARYSRLLDLLRPLQSALVAFSGGVDSTLLLAATCEALGRSRVLAVIGRSPTYPSREHEKALEVAGQIGVEVRTIDTREMHDPSFRQNPPDRCYHCKRTLFTALKQLAREEGLQVVLEGANADDTRDYRPGMRAGQELGIRAPLMEVGLTKAEIRTLARANGLGVWDKPSLACLASRIPYGSEISTARLDRIDRAEEALRALGFVQVRVRDHGDVARIEVEPDELERLVQVDVRQRVVPALKNAGYRFVALDLSGYRTGSMNEELHEGPADKPAQALGPKDRIR